MTEALQVFEADIYASSTVPVVRAKLKTVVAALAMWGDPPFPITAEKVKHLGSVLKAGCYKSAATYFSVWRVSAERGVGGHEAQELSPVITRAFTDAVRSCTRGLGGPIKAFALPFTRLGLLPGSRTPWSTNGPLSPRNAMVLGSWFLLREVELSSTRAALVEVWPTGDEGKPKVTWALPASKTDQRACGTVRSHGCCCSDQAKPRPDCPAHAAWDHLLFLKRTFPEGWCGDVPPPHLAMFPDAAGAPCSKDSLTATIVRAAQLLGHPLASPDGSSRISGHSLRATGAQGLAALGIDSWAIQLLGRWGSSAVLGYIRESALASSASWASRAVASIPLEDVVASISNSLPSGCPSPSSTLLDEVRSCAAICPAVVTAHASIQTDAIELLLPEVIAVVPSSVQLDLAFSSSGKAHRVVAGPPSVSLKSAFAACGWRFGSSDARLATEAALPSGFSELCEKCFPGLHAQRRLEFQARARQVGAFS
jgi:hypothetical protein